MDLTRLYYASTILCGVVVGAMGLSSVAAGNTGLAALLMAIGGVGTVCSAVYVLGFSENPSASVPADRWVWMMTLGAVLVLLGGGGQLLL
ncbi:hypothetical protein [Natronorubrum sp. DTA7]|uniref:hypothetical protein n=1 Tax=Natronorubrum sp. DTA7 TaxID=3447016 RepID=UPI003F843274